MEKATADQLEAFEAALAGTECSFKISGKGNLNVIGGDRELVAEAASTLGFFVVHIPSADSNGTVVGYDAKGFDVEGLNRDGLTASEARVAKKAQTHRPTAAPEVLREADGVTITKEGRRLYFTTPYGHPLATIVKDAGGKWEAASKRWWIGAAGNMNLVEALDALIEQERVRTAQEAERQAAAEEVVAKDLASRTWVAIPFEATAVREFAKANGAKWNPQTKCWGLSAEATDAVTAKLTEWKAARRAEAPLNLYAFNARNALTELVWDEGETIWSEHHDAYVTLVTVKRRWRSGEEDDGGEDVAGYSYSATGRLATSEEIAALQAQQKERNA